MKKMTPETPFQASSAPPQSVRPGRGLMTCDDLNTELDMIKNVENRKKYNEMANKNLVIFRTTPEERGLLESMMDKDGWENVSGFVKYKLFGMDPDRKVNELIERKNSSEIGTLLKNAVLDLTNYYIYVKYRYDKDMSQLYREEGVDVKKWISSTNKWHAELTKRTDRALSLIRRIADSLSIDSYFELPSDKMDIDQDTASKEEMDALAEQLRKERIAMGYGDNKE